MSYSLRTVTRKLPDTVDSKVRSTNVFFFQFSPVALPMHARVPSSQSIQGLGNNVIPSTMRLSSLLAPLSVVLATADGEI